MLLQAFGRFPRTSSVRKFVRPLATQPMKKVVPFTVFNRYDMDPSKAMEELMTIGERHDSEQLEWLQAVREVVEDLSVVFEREQRYISLMRHIMEPERLVKFKVPWIDDEGNSRVNRGYRVQYNSALGPYKGGIRFHPTVNESVLKFLGFEQVFKNALTTLPLGGGKGGSNFDPKGKSVAEVVRFCQSFITELHHYIGARRDVPAGDIGVGGREVGYMFGHYKRMTSDFDGVLTGKGVSWGGSHIRTEATGYGCVYFANEALVAVGKSLDGQRCSISGSGNVAQFTAEKLLHYGAIPVTFSDSTGLIYKPDGFTQGDIDILANIKGNRNSRVSELGNIVSGVQYFDGANPWNIEDIFCAFPSATQNEIDKVDAENLLSNGCQGVFEGANMPTTPEAISAFKGKLIYAPGKAANAGGVAVSGLEMAQNAQMTTWSREKVDERLHLLMKSIYKQCALAAEEYGHKGDLKVGANIAGFLRVANAIMDQGQ